MGHLQPQSTRPRPPQHAERPPAQMRPSQHADVAAPVHIQLPLRPAASGQVEWAEKRGERHRAAPSAATAHAPERPPAPVLPPRPPPLPYSGGGRLWCGNGRDAGAGSRAGPAAAGPAASWGPEGGPRRLHHRHHHAQARAEGAAAPAGHGGTWAATHAGGRPQRATRHPGKPVQLGGAAGRVELALGDGGEAQPATDAELRLTG